MASWSRCADVAPVLQLVPACDEPRGINPIVAGWMNYYGRFYRSQMAPLPPTPQHLPEALGGEQVPATADVQTLPTVVCRADRSTAQPVRPLEVGERLLTDDG